MSDIPKDQQFHMWQQPVHRKYCTECQQVYDAYYVRSYGTPESNMVFGAIMIGLVIIMIAWFYDRR